MITTANMMLFSHGSHERNCALVIQCGDYTTWLDLPCKTAGQQAMHIEFQTAN